MRLDGDLQGICAVAGQPTATLGIAQHVDYACDVRMTCGGYCMCGPVCCARWNATGDAIGEVVCDLPLWPWRGPGVAVEYRSMSECGLRRC